jgi:hypothetical protein
MLSLEIPRSLYLCECFLLSHKCVATYFNQHYEVCFFSFCLLCSLPDAFCYRFGPRESKKAMMYSDTGRLNCNVSYTTFSTPIRGQVYKML